MERSDKPSGIVDLSDDRALRNKRIDTARVDPFEDRKEDKDEEQGLYEPENAAQHLVDDLDGTEFLDERRPEFSDEPCAQLDEDDERNKADDHCAPTCKRRPAHCVREAEPAIERILHRNAECEGKYDGEDRACELADPLHKSAPYAE